MTDHTISAHFDLTSSISTTPKPDTEDNKIIKAMAEAIGGNPVIAEFEARKLFRAITAMKVAMSEV